MNAENRPFISDRGISFTETIRQAINKRAALLPTMLATLTQRAYSSHNRNTHLNLIGLKGCYEQKLNWQFTDPILGKLQNLIAITQHIEEDVEQTQEMRSAYAVYREFFQMAYVLEGGILDKKQEEITPTLKSDQLRKGRKATNQECIDAINTFIEKHYVKDGKFGFPFGSCKEIMDLDVKKRKLYPIAVEYAMDDYWRVKKAISPPIDNNHKLIWKQLFASLFPWFHTEIPAIDFDRRNSLLLDGYTKALEALALYGNGSSNEKSTIGELGPGRFEVVIKLLEANFNVVTFDFQDPEYLQEVFKNLWIYLNPDKELPDMIILKGSTDQNTQNILNARTGQKPTIFFTQIKTGEQEIPLKDGCLQAAGSIFVGHHHDENTPKPSEANPHPISPLSFMISELSRVARPLGEKHRAVLIVDASNDLETIESSLTSIIIQTGAWGTAPDAFTSYARGFTPETLSNFAQQGNPKLTWYSNFFGPNIPEIGGITLMKPLEIYVAGFPPDWIDLEKIGASL